MKMHDFRSDTVTKPTKAMREAMARAEVGDDVYEEDPTVNALEKKAAALMDKEASLFVPSGTMANLLAVLSVCNRGDEVMMGTRSHTFLHEAGGVSALGGVVIHTIPNEDDGRVCVKRLLPALRDPDNVHEPVSRMVIVENTQNDMGGVALSLPYMQRVGGFCQDHKLHLHVDGARIFNASTAFRCYASDLVASADSVSFCLSKGLAAPVGSMLCGGAAFIHRARKLRRMLGGGMRQVGVLAAAGIVALDTMIERLREDHERAYRLAKALYEIPGVKLTRGSPYTNMLYVALEDQFGSSTDVLVRLKQKGILTFAVGPSEYRFVTHCDVNDESTDACIEAFRSL